MLGEKQDYAAEDGAEDDQYNEIHDAAETLGTFENHDEAPFRANRLLSLKIACEHLRTRDLNRRFVL